jgi:hypothetical protein
MRDMIGNKLTEGNLLFWHRVGSVCKITHVSDGGLSLGDSHRTSPPILTIEITLPVGMEGAPPGAEPMVAEFLRVVDPKSEGVLQLAMGKRPQ